MLPPMLFIKRLIILSMPSFPHPFTIFVNELSKHLSEPLPGYASHAKMIPAERLADMQKTEGLQHAMPSSVLIALFEEAGDVFTLLIKRTADNGPHSGQISFPGGKKDSRDRTFIDTAIREAGEEIGLDPGQIIVLGQLSPLFVAPSNFVINPIVAVIEPPIKLALNSEEVEYIIELPITKLEDFVTVQNIEVRGRVLRDMPCFSCNGHVIWGATAMILQELRDVLAKSTV